MLAFYECLDQCCPTFFTTWAAEEIILKAVGNNRKLNGNDNILVDIICSIDGWVFIDSFIPGISIAPLQVYYYTEVLQTTACILCWS